MSVKNVSLVHGSHGYHGEIMIDKKNGVVVKTIRHTGSQSSYALHKEYLILGLINELGIGPHPIKYSTNPGVSDELTMEYIDGTPWNDLSQNQQYKLLPMVGKTLGQLHHKIKKHGYYEAEGIFIFGNLAECMQTNIDILKTFAKKYNYQTGLDFIEKNTHVF